MARRKAGPEEGHAEDFGRGFGRGIKVLRAARGLSRRQLAERAELSYSYLSEIENGAKSPSSRVLAAIARVLGVPAHQLVQIAEAESGEPPPFEARSRRPPREAAPMSHGAPEARELREDPSRGDDPSLGWVGAPALEGADLIEYEEIAAPAEAFAPPQFRARRLADRVLHRERPADDREHVRVPSALLAEIEAGRCVAFVGAGFSAAAALPAWGELLGEAARRGGTESGLRARVAERVSSGSAYALDEAAQLLEDSLGRERLLAVLDELLGSPPLTEAMAERLRWLRGIPFRSILTTGFDGLLDGDTPSRDAYRRALRAEPGRWSAPRYWGEAPQGAPTLKLHGDLRHRDPTNDGVVLTRRDHRRRLYDDPAYERFLHALMATTTVLYLGFSFEDSYLNELRSERLALPGQQGASAPVAYAVVNDVPAPTRQHFRHHQGIELLTYSSHAGSDFSGFDAYLHAIHEATNPLLRFARQLERKRILWVDPHPENNARAFEDLREAARVGGRSATALVTVATADEGLRLIAGATAEPFDLAITHWGDGAAREEDAGRMSAAERLLHGIRSRDLRCPVVVFAAAEDVERRSRLALGLGALAYCSAFETLYQTIERVLAPGAGDGDMGMGGGRSTDESLRGFRSGE